MSESILILGAGGFVGLHLTRTFAERGEKVIAVSRRPIALGMDNVENIVGAPDEPEHFLPLIKQCRAVVHTASRSTPGSSAGRAMAELQDNLHLTLALLQVLQQRPQTELLYVSSGGSLYTDTADRLATESSPVHPRSYHGAGKIAAEHFIGAWCSQYGGTATILRPSNIYGPGQRERAGFGIVPAVFGTISRGDTLPVWGGGSAVRDYLYIADFVALCIAALAKPMPAGSQVFNAASGVGVSLNELFAMIETVTGASLKRTCNAGRAVDAPRVVIDASRARQHYDWRATTSLREGLENTWTWFNTTQP